MGQWFQKDRGVTRLVFTLVGLLVLSAACTVYLFNTYHQRLAALEDDLDGFHGNVLRQLMRMREATHDLENLRAQQAAVGVFAASDWLRSSRVRASRHTCEDALARIEALHEGRSQGRYGGAVARVHARLDTVHDTEGALDSLTNPLGELDFSLRQLERLHLAAHEDLVASQPAFRRTYAIQLALLGGLVVILSGILVASNISAIRRIVRRRAEHQERLHRLMLELDHRVKNTLATVLAIASQTERSTSTSREFHAAFTSRIAALVGVHESLANSLWQGVGLPDLVARMIEPYQAEQRDRITVTGADVLLPSTAATVTGMILHELVTNAVKHGALSDESGSVRVGWECRERDDGLWLALEWEEHGGPAVAPIPDPGFGTTFIRGAAAYELHGEAEFSFASSGVRCRVTFPLGEGEEPARVAEAVRGAWGGRRIGASAGVMSRSEG